MPSTANKPAQLALHRRAGDVLTVQLSGDWLAQAGLPGLRVVEESVAQGAPISALDFDTTDLGAWNSGLLVFLNTCREWCERRQISFRVESLPVGVQKLLRLATAVQEQKDARRESTAAPWLSRVGQHALAGWEGGRDMLTFLGETVLALGRMARGRSQCRWSDTLLIMQQCGPQALGIVALINFLVGMILAFVGAVQLQRFGASIYVADLVAIAAVRELGCIMTGIILCGRTGAAFAAQLGTMTVNEEVDALKTFGISPVDFLVLPRVLAMMVMMPLLCVFADLIAILGGYAVAIIMLDLASVEYVRRTIAAITLTSFSLGILKGGFFGLLVALTGCLRGIQCGSTAAAVGLATTSAVVIGITSIIAADGLLAVVCNALGI